MMPGLNYQKGKKKLPLLNKKLEIENNIFSLLVVLPHILKCILFIFDAMTL